MVPDSSSPLCFFFGFDSSAFHSLNESEQKFGPVPERCILETY